MFPDVRQDFANLQPPYLARWTALPEPENSLQQQRLPSSQQGPLSAYLNLN